MKKKTMSRLLTATLVVCMVISGCSALDTPEAASVTETTETKGEEKGPDSTEGSVTGIKEAEAAETTADARTSEDKKTTEAPDNAEAVEEETALSLWGKGELFTVKEKEYQIETKTLPLYIGDTDPENTFEIEVAFMDGVTDIPYITLDTMESLIARVTGLFYGAQGGEKYSLEIEKDADTVTLTRETQYPARIDFAKDTIKFYDYDAFIRISDSDPLLDVIASTGFNEDGKPHLFQKSDSSFERYGDPVTFSPGEYGIDLVAQGGEYYLPLQLVSDIILSQYSVTTLYNGEAVFAQAGGNLDAIADKYYISNPPAERSQELAAFNYKELCFALDALYGLKEQHNIKNFNNLFQMTGLAVDMLSTDPQVAGQALADLTIKYFDDSHSGFISKSYMMKQEPERNFGPSIINRRDDKERYTKAREKYYPDEIPGYEEVGNTAYITFDEFYFADVDYYSGEKPEDHPEDTVGLMIHAYNEITREGSPIENVVLDLSNNGGGMADAAAYVIGMFLGDGSICMMNPLSGALVSQNFKIDANLDRKFDEKDSLRNYNLFCLTTSKSFSCGNLVPSVFKNSNRVMILGQTSGGGACVVQNLTTADGCPFQISGLKRLAYMKNGSFYDIDQGVTPDFVIPKPEQFYDRQYLTTYINGLLGI